MSVGMPLDSKHTEDSFSPTSTDSLQLRINQVPRYRDLAILVVTTDRQTNRLLHPCACAWSNKCPHDWLIFNLKQHSYSSSWGSAPQGLESQALVNVSSSSLVCAWKTLWIFQKGSLKIYVIFVYAISDQHFTFHVRCDKIYVVQIYTTSIWFA